MNSKMFLLITLAVFQVTAYSQEGEDCSRTKNPAKRLACFDVRQKQITIRDEENNRQKEINAKVAREREEYITAAKPALVALQKMRSNVNIGISYRDYSAPLSAANFEVDNFLRNQPLSIDNGEFSVSIAKALNHYIQANYHWKTAMINAGKRYGDDVTVSPALLAAYPEIYQYTSQVGEYTVASYKRVLSIIWQAASREVGIAEASLAQGQHPHIRPLDDKSPTTDQQKSVHAAVVQRVQPIAPVAVKTADAVVTTDGETAKVVQFLSDTGFPLVGVPTRFKQKGNLTFYEARGTGGRLTQVACEAGVCRLRTIND